MDGFEGSREQEVLVAYLEAIGPEGRDRVIGAACLAFGGLGIGEDPCLVQVAEASRDHTRAPHSIEIGASFGKIPVVHPPGVLRGVVFATDFGVVPTAFDNAVYRHGQPFIAWLKRTAAEMNGSDPTTIDALTHPTDSAVPSEKVVS